MRRLVALSTLCVLLMGSGSVAWAHCEIPCGIYTDTMRIDMLYEHIRTVEKSMKQIEELSADPSANANQLIRWVGNKEDHCDEIQHIVTQYFMTQRIKPASASDSKAHEAYVSRLAALHGILVHAMKAKQTTDQAHIDKLRELVKAFSGLYFSAKDLQHIKASHPQGK